MQPGSTTLFALSINPASLTTILGRLKNMLNWLRNFLRPTIIVELTDAKSEMPFYGSEDAAGADLIASQPSTIPPGQKMLVQTGVKMKLPKGHYLKIESRSGLSVKFSLETGAGVIDADYRGKIGVVLHNFGPHPYNIIPGERVAQGVLQKYRKARFVEGKVDEDTKRGVGGWGSTGK
jgi:dUTP pyrophosphatase